MSASLMGKLKVGNFPVLDIDWKKGDTESVLNDGVVSIPMNNDVLAFSFLVFGYNFYDIGLSGNGEHKSFDGLSAKALSFLELQDRVFDKLYCNGKVFSCCQLLDYLMVDINNVCLYTEITDILSETGIDRADEGFDATFDTLLRDVLGAFVVNRMPLDAIQNEDLRELSRLYMENKAELSVLFDKPDYEKQILETFFE